VILRVKKEVTAIVVQITGERNFLAEKVSFLSIKGPRKKKAEQERGDRKKKNHDSPKPERAFKKLEEIMRCPPDKEGSAKKGETGGTRKKGDNRAERAACT